MDRHNDSLKVLFFARLRDLKLADSVPPWYSRVDPKALYVSEAAQAYWDVPVYAEHTFVQTNRVDMWFGDQKSMGVLAELSVVGQSLEEIFCEDSQRNTNHCSGSLPNSTQTIRSYSWTSSWRFRGWSKELNVENSKIFGVRSSNVLKRMQKAVLSKRGFYFWSMT